MLTLSEYDKIAHKLIFRWNQSNFKVSISDELVGRIVRFLAMADWKYCKKKAKGKTRRQYRRMWGIYAIREYLKDNIKRKYFLFVRGTNNQLKIPLNYIDDMRIYKDSRIELPIKISNKINFLLKNSSLSERELSVLKDYMTTSSISWSAERLGITYDQCRQLYYSAITKMKRISNVE